MDVFQFVRSENEDGHEFILNFEYSTKKLD